VVVDVTTAPFVIRGDDVPYREAHGADLRRFGQFLISPGQQADAPLTLGRFRYPPGARSHAHVHPYATEVYYCVLGQLEANVDGVAHRLEPGDLVVIPPGNQHYAANAGEGETEFVAIHVPPVSDYDEFSLSWRPVLDAGEAH
jgi:quercetin dioxygenase-like cupin family protein